MSRVPGLGSILLSFSPHLLRLQSRHPLTHGRSPTLHPPLRPHSPLTCAKETQSLRKAHPLPRGRRRVRVRETPPDNGERAAPPSHLFYITQQTLWTLPTVDASGDFRT